MVQVVDGLSIVSVIRKKRDGEELSDNEIEWFVSAATDSLITEAQIGTKNWTVSQKLFAFWWLSLCHISTDF